MRQSSSLWNRSQPNTPWRPSAVILENNIRIDPSKKCLAERLLEGSGLCLKFGHARMLLLLEQ